MWWSNSNWWRRVCVDGYVWLFFTECGLRKQPTRACLDLVSVHGPSTDDTCMFSGQLTSKEDDRFDYLWNLYYAHGQLDIGQDQFLCMVHQPITCVFHTSIKHVSLQTHHHEPIISVFHYVCHILEDFGARRC